jgi:hypothetical protein
MKLHFNLNSGGSLLVLDAFNTEGAQGVDVTITEADTTGVTLALTRRVGAGLGKFTLTRRSKGVCLGGYLKKEFIGELDLLQKKCFIEQTGSMMNRKIKVLFSTAAHMEPDRAAAFVSFDPHFA